MTEKERFGITMIVAGIALPVVTLLCGQRWASGVPPNQGAMVEAFIAFVVAIVIGLVLMAWGVILLIAPRGPHE